MLYIITAINGNEVTLDKQPPSTAYGQDIAPHPTKKNTVITQMAGMMRVGNEIHLDDEADCTALRYNEGKTRWSLVDWKSMEPMVRVLEFGAKKYTNNLISFQKLISLIQLGQELEYVRIVLKKNTYLLNDSVVHVIENGHVQYDHVYPVGKTDNLEQNHIVDLASKKYDYKTTQKNGAINKSIGENTQENQSQNKRIESVMQKEKKIQNMYEKINDLDFLGDLGNTVSLKIFMGVSPKEVVQYVDLLRDYILTITIQHDNIEVYFVVNATNEYDCLMTLFKKLKVLGIIGNTIHESSIIEIQSGIDNWKKPMDKKQILNSAMRHLIAIMNGEENDPESGLPHVGHLMCNAMFYSYHSK